MPDAALSLHTLTCPACRRTVTQSLPPVLNAALHPAERERILNHSFFTVSCPHCGESWEILYNLLYCDPLRRFMIALQPDTKMPFPSVSHMDIPTPEQLRVVHDAEDLAEKIQQMEDPVDDRLIETAKYLFYLKIRNALPPGSLMGMPVFHRGPEGPVISLPMEIKGKGYAMGTDRLTPEKLQELDRLYHPLISAELPGGFREIGRDYARRLVEFCRRNQTG